MLNDFAGPAQQVKASRGGELVSYVMSRVNRWRNFRDGNYEAKWRDYECVYRGEWNARLKTKSAERSKVITPATTNAVDQAVSEIVEAIFGRGNWFDIDEDGKPPQEVQAAKALQSQLINDLHDHGIKKALIDTVYLGAIYGTGIAKRIIETEDYEELDPTGQVKETERPCVSWEAVPPKNFVIDSAATSVETAHGVAHETLRPKHEVAKKQRDGVYFDGDIGDASGFGSSDILMGTAGETYDKDPQDGVYITEYHGLVPRWMLTDAKTGPSPKDPLEDLAESKVDEPEDTGTERDDLDLVEAIVTIGNGSTLLKANETPILNKDRGFIAYQHYAVPNRFWGMGIPEKAWNSQSALDAEIRARMDTLALVTYPSITADVTRLPKQLDLTVSPGKVFRTNGRGSEIIEPMKFGNLDPVTFQHTADLERYVQLATGAADPSTPVNTNRGAQATASGGSMQFGSYIKRAKLPMQTIDEQFLDPLVRKTLLAYMTVDPDRYPVMFDYTVNSTLGIMAREFEQMQLTNLMALLPQGSPEYQTVLKAIITNYSGPAQDQLLADIEKAQQPDPGKQAMQQLQQQTAQATLQKLQAEIAEVTARADYTKSKIGTDQTKLKQHDQQLHIEAAQTMVSQAKLDHAYHSTGQQHTNSLVAAVLKAHHINKSTAAKVAAKAED